MVKAKVDVILTNKELTVCRGVHPMTTCLLPWKLIDPSISQGLCSVNTFRWNNISHESAFFPLSLTFILNVVFKSVDDELTVRVDLS